MPRYLETASSVSDPRAKRISLRAIGMTLSELNACTIVSKNYLPFARVLARSYVEHHPGVRFFVLLVDRVDGYFDPAEEDPVAAPDEAPGDAPEGLPEPAAAAADGEAEPDEPA